MKTPLILLSLISIVTLFGCVPLDSSYNNGGSYGGGYGNQSGYGYGYDNDYYEERERERLRDERREIERDRERLEREQEKLERQRQREREAQSRPPPQEQCPSGFHPRERSCSKDERKKGCRDIRLNSGMGCVSL